MFETVVKERPILFSGPMVRAILDGRKTQTRRIMKPQHVDLMERDDDGRFMFMHAPTCGSYCDYACASEGEVLDGHVGWTPWGSHPERHGRLWVRETFLTREAGRHVVYKADMDPIKAAGFGAMYGGWKPSIFMPRAASRITLEITRVRVERLQDISEADALAEGFVKLPASGRVVLSKGGQYFGNAWSNAREAFAELWEAINGKGSWQRNPWVWAIDFVRVNQE